LCSSQLSDRQWTLLGIDRIAMRANSLADGHRTYLRWHRSKVFQNEATYVPRRDGGASLPSPKA
jgi:hypothetical protein